MRRVLTIAVGVLTIAVGVLTVLAVGCGAGLLYFFGFSPDRTKYPIRGIDVSHHQGVIDWQKVARDDVSFAIIKATEGGDHVDGEFLSNFLAARSLGLAVGAYHFFTFCRSGAEQAANFIRTVPRDAPQLPPVVDIEYEGNCSARPTMAELRTELDAFLAPVEAAFGQEAVIYITGGAWPAYGDALPERDHWVRWIAWHPGDDDWRYWQYHDRGRVDGIAGDVDLNVLRGGSEALSALMR